MSLPGSGSLPLATFTQQATAALANVTINFAIWKYETPTEYQPLKKALTPRRTAAAEDGEIHATACKLGALFAPVLPKFPLLCKAYGRRASDIAMSSAKSTEQSSSFGAFSDYAGVDGTTILAAATSGEAAIAAHLLACMLAQQFRADKAIAAWEELVAERKSQLLAEPQISVPINTMMATRAEITTRELAIWDASARSWLALANSVESRRQKQLMLILDNLEGVVKPMASTYATVLNAWCEALSIFEKIVQGGAHAVQSGSLLLAVSSWHLYPDITCLGSSTTNITFQDSLIIPGAALTVGLLENSPSAPHNGVYWSLSLSRLRYYGDVQTAESIMNIDSSVVSLEDFCVIALGAASCHWTAVNTDIDKSCEFFIFLDKIVRKECATVSLPWTALFCETSLKLQQLEASEKSYANRLFKLGQRNKRFFESDDGCALFDFDLESKHGLMQIFTKLCEESYLKSKMLRLAINRHYKELQDSFCIISRPEDKLDYTLELANHDVYFKPQMLVLSWFLENMDNRYIKKLIESSLPTDRMRAPSGFLLPLRYSKSSEIDKSKARSKVIERFIWVDPPITYKRDHHDKTLAKTAIDICPHSTDMKIPVDFQWLMFERVYGDDVASLFSTQSWKVQIPKYMWTLDDVLVALEKGTLQYVKLVDRMRKHVNSIRAFAAAHEALREMPQMKISLANVLKTPLSSQKWAPTSVIPWSQFSKTQSQQSYLDTCFSIPRMNTAQIFASIASLLAEVHDLEPNQLSDVMALSFQDSLFVVKALLSDPYNVSDQVTRICGNIGRPGLALLIPPTNPKVRKSDPSKWAMINHFDFDGSVQDSFAGTDMSVWFTDYERPVQQNTHSGEKFIPAYFLECVVSVYDRGRWIADVDVIHNKQHLRFHRYEPTNKEMTASQLNRSAEEVKTITLDNWDEVLACNDVIASCVARAHKNWLGRLALATILQQKGRHVIILPPDQVVDTKSVIANYEISETARRKNDGLKDSLPFSQHITVFLQ